MHHTAESLGTSASVTSPPAVLSPKIKNKIFIACRTLNGALLLCNFSSETHSNPKLGISIGACVNVSICCKTKLLCLLGGDSVFYACWRPERWHPDPLQSFSDAMSESEPRPVAKFIVPEWGIYLTPPQGCFIGLPSYVAWWAGTTTLCRSQLYPPKQGL